MRVNNINVMLLLTPKANLAYLDETQSVRQALEKMRFHHFTAIPLISKEEGLYLSASDTDISIQCFIPREDIVEVFE